MPTLYKNGKIINVRGRIRSDDLAYLIPDQTSVDHIPVFDENKSFVRWELSPEKVEELKNKENKKEQDQKLQKATVKTSKGNIFDATLEARVNMSAAIRTAKKTGQMKTRWRMADNSEPVITLEELEEADSLALEKFAEIKNIPTALS